MNKFPSRLRTSEVSPMLRPQWHLWLGCSYLLSSSSASSSSSMYREQSFFKTRRRMIVRNAVRRRTRTNEFTIDGAGVAGHAVLPTKLWLFIPFHRVAEFDFGRLVHIRNVHTTIHPSVSSIRTRLHASSLHQEARAATIWSLLYLRTKWWFC